MGLCDQVENITTYRTQLFDYLRNRMTAIAPNLTCIVGELVGARLIAHAGSLMNLAKHPASTVQILGAEKALFRALKTKHDTPKYGLIYHASLVGQAAPKFKGKISRVLAAKASLSVRQDALGDSDGVTIALDHKAKVEARLRVLEGGSARAISGTGKTQTQQVAHTPAASTSTYNEAADVAMDDGEKKKKKKKDKVKEEPVADEKEKKKKKRKLQLHPLKTKRRRERRKKLPWLRLLNLKKKTKRRRQKNKGPISNQFGVGHTT